jgi:hypothetical protein
LARVTILFVTEFVQEHTLPVAALLMTKPCRTVLGCTELCFQDTIAIPKPIDCRYALGRVILIFECNIDAEGLLLAIGRFSVADGNLINVTILSKKLRLPESLE